MSRRSLGAQAAELARCGPRVAHVNLGSFRRDPIRAGSTIDHVSGRALSESTSPTGAANTMATNATARVRQARGGRGNEDQQAPTLNQLVTSNVRAH